MTVTLKKTATTMNPTTMNPTCFSCELVAVCGGNCPEAYASVCLLPKEEASSQCPTCFEMSWKHGWCCNCGTTGTTTGFIGFIPGPNPCGMMPTEACHDCQDCHLAG